MAYDIHFQPVPSSEVEGLKVFTFGFTSALKVQGLQALVNRWAKTFMTPKGSNPLDPNEGTDFAALAGSNVDRNSPELRDVVIISVDDANDQVRLQDIAGFYSSDESLLNATLEGFRQTDDGVGLEVWVTVQNIDEDVLTIKLMELATR
jgi:hypothetical protein